MLLRVRFYSQRQEVGFSLFLNEGIRSNKSRPFVFGVDTCAKSGMIFFRDPKRYHQLHFIALELMRVNSYYPGFFNPFGVGFVK